MKKKILTSLLCCLIAVGCFVTGVLAAGNIQEVKAYINYEFNMKFDDVAWTPTEDDGTVIRPIIYNDRTYLPVRAIGEKLGIAVDFDATTKTVYLGEHKAAEKPPVVTPETPTTPKTLGELESKGYEYMGYMGIGGSYLFNYTTATRSYDVAVEFPDSAKQALDSLSIFDKDYEQKAAAIRSPLVIKGMESRNKAEPLSDMELAKYVGKKASALIDAGFEMNGYSGSNGEYTFTFESDKQEYHVTLDAAANEIMKNKKFGDDSYEEKIMSCTITKMVYSNPC